MPRSPSAFPVQPKRGLARQTEPSPESPTATFVRPSHFETRGIRIARSALALASTECAECHRNQACHGSVSVIVMVRARNMYGEGAATPRRCAVCNSLHLIEHVRECRLELERFLDFVAAHI